MPNVSAHNCAVESVSSEAALLAEVEGLARIAAARRRPSLDLVSDHSPDTYSPRAAGGGRGPRGSGLGSRVTDQAVIAAALRSSVNPPPTPAEPGCMCPANDLDADHEPARKRWTPVVEVPFELVEEIDRRCPSAKVRRLRDRLLYIVSLTCDPATAHETHGYRVRLSSKLLAEACGEYQGREVYRDLGRELEAAGLLEVGEAYSNPKTRARSTGRRKRGTCKEYLCTFPWLGAPRARVALHTMSLTFKRHGLEEALRGKDPALAYLAACYQQSDLDVPHALRLFCTEHGLSSDLAAGELDEEHRERLSRALVGDEVLRRVRAAREAIEARAAARKERAHATLEDIAEESGVELAALQRLARGQAALSAIMAGWVGPKRGQGEVWFKRDETAGRLHHPVANLPAYLRPALRLAGSGRLVGLDLKCSQPTIAAAWMKKDGLALTDDGSDWLALVAQRDIYAETYEAATGRAPTKAERDAWKRTLFAEWWYARLQVMRQGEVGQALAARWPTVHAWILERKGAEEGGYASFPVELQAREAAIFIDDLALRLQRAGVLALTIHDSLIVREEDAARAELEMRAALAVLDFPAQLERTNYSSAQHHGAEGGLG